MLSPEQQDPQDSLDQQDPHDLPDQQDLQDPQDSRDPPKQKPPDLMNDIPEWMWNMWWRVLKKMPCYLCTKEIRGLIWLYFDTMCWGEWHECKQCQPLLVKCEKCPLEHNLCKDCTFMFNYHLTCYKKWCDEIMQDCKNCQYCQAFPPLTPLQPKYSDRFIPE
jgi:hypothetical protein